jgi:hypothetical protein
MLQIILDALLGVSGLGPIAFSTLLFAPLINFFRRHRRGFGWNMRPFPTATRFVGVFRCVCSALVDTNDKAEVSVAVAAATRVPGEGSFKMAIGNGAFNDNDRG